MQVKGGNQGAANSAESMYDATGQLKIKTLAANGGGGMNNNKDNSKNKQHIHNFVCCFLEKNPF